MQLHWLIQWTNVWYECKLYWGGNLSKKKKNQGMHYMVEPYTLLREVYGFRM